MAEFHLRGKKVLITRAAESAGEMAVLLEREGAVPVLFPTIKTVPAGNMDDIKSAVSNLDGFNWIIFSSVNAVKYFFENLKSLNTDITEQKLFPVGEKTAEVLKERGYSVESLPAEYSAEGLLENFEKLDCTGRRILIPGAAKTRDILSDGLRKLGAVVTVLPVYETVIPSADEVGELPTDINILTFTSPSTFHNFETLAGRRFADMMKNCVVAVIGTVTAEALKKRGFEPDMISSVFTVKGMVDGLRKYRK